MKGSRVFKRGSDTVTVCIVFMYTLTSCAQTVIQAVPFQDKLRGMGIPLIVNGQSADPAEYPVSFQSGTGQNDICSWFLVGSQILVGAAHCLEGPSGINVRKIEITTSSQKYTGVCNVPDKYPHDPSLDLALCLMTPPYVIPRGPEIPVRGYEVLNADPTKISEMQKIEISGFGCTTPGGGVSNNYMIGQSRIVVVPPSAHMPSSGGSTPNSIEIRQAPSMLCSGDSGGPAFLYQKTGRVYRVVVGVNTATAFNDGAGYLASTSTTDSKKFISDWSKKNGQRVCGMDDDAKGCRPFVH